MCDAKMIERLLAEVEDLRRAKERAETDNRAKNEFLANISHELRIPLNSILGFSQLLIEKHFGELNSKQTEYMKEIVASAENLLDLINEVISIAKIEIGSVELEKTVFPIQGIMEQCVLMVKGKCAKDNIRLKLEASPDLPGLEILGDNQKIKRIIFDVLSQAVKLTSPGGEIAVRAWPEGEKTVIVVANSEWGGAFSDQADISRESNPPGDSPAGKHTPSAGLFLARQLAAMHGGDIRQEGGGRQSGGRFVLELPTRRSKEDANLEN